MGSSVSIFTRTPFPPSVLFLPDLESTMRFGPITLSYIHLKSSLVSVVTSYSLGNGSVLPMMCIQYKEDCLRPAKKQGNIAISHDMILSSALLSYFVDQPKLTLKAHRTIIQPCFSCCLRLLMPLPNIVRGSHMVGIVN